MKPFAPFLKPSSSRRLWLAGAAVLAVIGLIVLLVGIWNAIISGKTRQFGAGEGQHPAEQTDTSSSTPVGMSARRLDGVIVTSTLASLRPWAFMIDNQVDARPAEGLQNASVVYEAPVEGGITRLMAIFDPMTDQNLTIGAVRSSRPYFVDWASSMKAVYSHVGGSPEALDKLAQIPSSTLLNVDEMTRGANAFRRDPNRIAPHQVVTTPARFSTYLGDVATSTVQFSSWRYTNTPAPTSTTPDVASVRITYGGSYTVRWTYDATKNQYRRIQAVKALSTKDIYATNIIVLKTDAQILDEKGRLRVRTTGGGEAILYRDGKKMIGRWRRSAGDVIGFVSTDGADLELRPGNTWIQVTTDDVSFAGLDA